MKPFTYDKTIVLVGDSSKSPVLSMDTIEHTLLPGIFPLKFTFDLNSELSLSAQLDGEIEAEVGYTIASGASAGVMRKDGEWIWVRESVLEPQRYGPVFRGEKNFRSTARLTNTIRLTLGERAQGYLQIEPANAEGNFSQEINADTGQCPTHVDLSARGAIEGQFASIKIPLLGQRTIMDEAKSVVLYDKTLIDETSQLELPGICDPNYMPPMDEGTQLQGQKCGGGEGDCIASADCYQSTCVRRGTLRVSTAYQNDTDVDLYLTTPSGNEVTYRHEGGAEGGGRYDFENCLNKCAYAAPHVESIFFEDGAEDGTYKVYVSHFEARSETPFEIQVKAGDQALTFRGDLPMERDVTSEVFEFVLEGGAIVGGMSVGGSSGGDGHPVEG